MNLLNIFEVIVLSSLIGTVIVLMILIIKGMFRNNLNSTFHYYIWLNITHKINYSSGATNPFKCF